MRFPRFSKLSDKVYLSPIELQIYKGNIHLCHIINASPKYASSSATPAQFIVFVSVASTSTIIGAHSFYFEWIIALTFLLTPMVNFLAILGNSRHFFPFSSNKTTKNCPIGGQGYVPEIIFLWVSSPCNPFFDFEQKGGGAWLYGRRSAVIWQEERGYIAGVVIWCNVFNCHMVHALWSDQKSCSGFLHIMLCLNVNMMKVIEYHIVTSISTITMITK